MNRTRRIAAIATLAVLTVAGSVAAAARPDRPEPSRPAPPATVSDADDTGDEDMDTSEDGMDESEDGMGPDTTGSASFGLCTAWSHNADQAKDATPFRSLTAEICDPVLAAGPNGERAERASGRPSSAGTGLDRAAEASDGRRP